MTQHIHRILVPIDFSPCSTAAFEYALGLAGPLGAEVVALHAWEPPLHVGVDTLVFIPEGPPESLSKVAHDTAAREMERFLIGHGDRARGRVEIGAPVEVILAESRDYDLIVMGTHGRSGIAHLLLGSVAERIVRRATCPVLTVRGGAR
jgi:universal stress protein A